MLVTNLDWENFNTSPRHNSIKQNPKNWKLWNFNHHVIEKLYIKCALLIWNYMSRIDYFYNWRKKILVKTLEDYWEQNTYKKVSRVEMAE